MSYSPLISVIVPIFNVEKYLRQCLDSILAQSYENIEIIAIDDGSADSSLGICREYAEKDQRLVVYHQENKGLCSARNRGISMAKGEYIGFVDSDDWIEPDMYERLLAGFSVTQNVMITNGMLLQHDDCSGKSWEMFPERWSISDNRIVEGNNFQLDLLSETSNHFVCTKLYRKELFDYVRFSEGHVDEDTLLHYELGKAMEKYDWNMVDIPYRVYHYRLRENSVCTSRIKPERFDRLNNLAYIYNDLGDNEKLLRCVERLRARSLYYFTKEVIANKQWRRLYGHFCKEEMGRTSIATLKRSLEKEHFRRSIIIKYAPWMYFFLLKSRGAA